MTKAYILLFIVFSFNLSMGQDFGDFPKIKKELLLNDLELLHQGLDKFHSGMYWYTSKDSVEMAFENARNAINKDKNVLEFHKVIAPLIAITREDHTNTYIPKEIRQKMNKESTFIPLIFVFLGKKLYCIKNGSDFTDYKLEGKEIESINGEKPIDIVNKLGNQFASDGFIKAVKYADLSGFSFSKYYFYYYGNVPHIQLKLKEDVEPLIIKTLVTGVITKNLRARYPIDKTLLSKDLLEYRIINDSTAYLGVHTFSNDDIREESKEKRLDKFLERSFKAISQNNIKTLIVDVSSNSGGDEGNESLLYSYFGENYQKYSKVRVKTQKAILENGVDKPIVLKSLGFLERIYLYQKLDDGSLERIKNRGFGLMAFKKKPKYVFRGTTYVVISPVTYSGGSEFSNMMYTNKLATFIGQETGGGYYGNTSGYSQKLILPNSKIEISIPALQFMMNVKPLLPFGSGVKPHYLVIPTFQEFINKTPIEIDFILDLESKK